jgi:hypothetical protein
MMLLEKFKRRLERVEQREAKEVKDGAQGPKGDKGADGKQGPKGPAGPSGPRGSEGPSGPKGSEGPKGEDGEAGLGIVDAYTAADGDLVFVLSDESEVSVHMPLSTDENGQTIVYSQGGGSGGEGGSMGPVTTSMVVTEPDVLFRDAKGRFKSVTVPDLKNQLEVNRWFVEQLESLEAGEIDLPEMTNDWTPNTLALRDNNGNSKFTQVTVKNITFAQNSVANNMADTWFLSGGEQSANGVKKNSAAGMRSSLSVYSKDEVDALSGGDLFFKDIGSNTIEYFGDQLWVTSLRDPFFIGAKLGSDSEFTGTVTANKFVGDGSGLTGTVSTKTLAKAFGDIQAALSDEKTVAGLKKALTNSLGGLIETLDTKDLDKEN